MTLTEGSILGPYEILSPIGAGGMGEVYRAKDRELQREVAIKVLPADVASSPERLQRFEREATTVASLNHPNIVTIHGIHNEGGHRFIAMELVEGETLDRMIAVGGMPLAKIMVLHFAWLVTVLGCTATRDIAHYPFPEAQAELRKVLDGIIHDSETANVVGLRDIHLKSEKFTKFGGGEVYDRMNYEQCVEIETAAITSVEDYKAETRDLKIDVFGEVAVMTFYPHRVVKKDGKVHRYSTRQTLVFLNTADGWKIVHEHQSPKKYEE